MDIPHVEPPFIEGLIKSVPLNEVHSFIKEVQKYIPEAFLTGSYRFGRENHMSDIDIAIPIHESAELIKFLDHDEHASKKLIESHYNAGVKFERQFSGQIRIVNIVKLHPLEFCCWSKAAKMLNAGNFNLKNVEKRYFHSIHQLAVTMSKMAITDLVTTHNYKEYM